jgi:hypothetical protein
MWPCCTSLTCSLPPASKVSQGIQGMGCSATFLFSFLPLTPALSYLQHVIHDLHRVLPRCSALTEPSACRCRSAATWASHTAPLSVAARESAGLVGVQRAAAVVVVTLRPACPAS